MDCPCFTGSHSIPLSDVPFSSEALLQLLPLHASANKQKLQLSLQKACDFAKKRALKNHLKKVIETHSCDN